MNVVDIIIGGFATVGALGTMITVGVVLYVAFDFKRNDNYEEGYIGVGNGGNELEAYKKSKSHLKVVK